MRPALEYFLYSAKCEQIAQATQDDKDRLTLLATAERWRKLGNDAKAREIKAISKPRGTLRKTS